MYALYGDRQSDRGLQSDRSIVRRLYSPTSLLQSDSFNVCQLDSSIVRQFLVRQLDLLSNNQLDLQCDSSLVRQLCLYTDIKFNGPPVQWYDSSVVKMGRDGSIVRQLRNPIRHFCISFRKIDTKNMLHFQTVGLQNCQTIQLQDYRTVGLSSCRTIQNYRTVELSDYKTVRLCICRTIQL